MNCHQFERLLDAYLNGELQGSLKLEFETHMVDCESCGHEFAMMEAIGAIISDEAEIPPLSEDFTDRVMAQLAKQNHPQIDFHTLRNGLSIAASIALVLGGMLFSLMGRSTTNPDPRLIGSYLLASRTVPTGSDLMGDPISTIGAYRSENPQTQQEINQWLAGTLEQAGSDLWELKELRSSAVDQVRRGLFKGLTTPSAIPVHSASQDPSVPGKSIYDSFKEILPFPGNNLYAEAGIELL